MPRGNCSARKRLFASNDGNQKSGRETIVRKQSSKKFETKIQNQPVFVPHYEKPNTCSKTFKKKAQLVVRTVAKPLKWLNVGSRSRLKLVDENFKNGADVSNNNATLDTIDVMMVDPVITQFNEKVKDQPTLGNPDPSKYVLTKWGNLTVLGKRKHVSVQEEEGQDDGITLDVEMDDFAEEKMQQGNQTINTSSDEEGVQLGDSASEENNSRRTTGKNKDKSAKDMEAQMMDNLLQFQTVMSKLLEQQLKQLLPRCLMETTGSGIGQQGANVNQAVGRMIKKSSQSESMPKAKHVVKSPSDTTIYAPALLHKELNNQNIEQPIENFVGATRREVEQVLPGNGNEYDPGEGTSQQSDGKMFAQESEELRAMEKARKKAEATILEAERFRANIASLPGNVITDFNGALVAVNTDENMHFIQNGVEIEVQKPLLHEQPRLANSHEAMQMNNNGSGLSDDDFFHLTCHIEPSLIQKIENGEFVELEKLLPKDRNSFSKGGASENRLEWVQRDGNMFLVAAGN